MEKIKNVICELSQKETQTGQEVQPETKNSIDKTFVFCSHLKNSLFDASFVYLVLRLGFK